MTVKVTQQEREDLVSNAEKRHVCEGFKSGWLKISKRTKIVDSQNQPYLRESPPK